MKFYTYTHIHSPIEAKNVTECNTRRIHLIRFSIVLTAQPKWILVRHHILLPVQSVRLSRFSALENVAFNENIIFFCSLVVFITSAYQRFSRDKYQFQKLSRMHAANHTHTNTTMRCTHQAFCWAKRNALISFFSVSTSIYGTETPNRVFVVPCKYFIDSEIFDYLINV